MLEARPVLERAIASMDIEQLDGAIQTAHDILGKYDHMVAVSSRELRHAKRLRQALEAWTTLATQLDHALRQGKSKKGRVFIIL